MKAVFDTGVFVSALITDRGFSYRAVVLWVDGTVDLVTSAWQIEEIRTVSRYERIAPRVVPHHVGALINRLRRRATVLESLPEVDYSPDADDNPILAAAVVGGVQYVVSGDKGDLLSLEAVQGIQIVSARAFVELFS